MTIQPYELTLLRPADQGRVTPTQAAACRCHHDPRAQGRGSGLC